MTMMAGSIRSFWRPRSKPAQGTLAIRDAWSNFLSILQQPAGNIPSNLFVQLYRKMQLVRHLLGEQPIPDVISESWKIGKNDVVLRAAKLVEPYAKEARFLALVPDSPSNLSRSFSEIIGGFSTIHGILPAWDQKHLGYLAWSQVETRCRERPADWHHALANFEHNLGQIYVV